MKGWRAPFHGLAALAVVSLLTGFALDADPNPGQAADTPSPVSVASASRALSPTEPPSPPDERQVQLTQPLTTYQPGPPSASGKPVIYFGIDDGPSCSDQVTWGMLDLFEDHGALATWFVTGYGLACDPAAMKAIVANGHAIGNHTYNHENLTTLTDAGRLATFDKVQALVTNSGGPMLTCYRPPYGATNASVRASAAKRGMVEWLWSVDPRDWANPGVSSIISSLNTLGNGDVVVIHDGNQNQQTLDALRIWLPANAGRFAFEPLPGCATAPPRYCAGLQATIVGTNGNDVLNGTPGRDVMWAGSGSDTIVSGHGPDVICGGFGDDTLRGGPGDDTVYGAGGNDLLFGSDGADTLSGNAGNDTVYGAAGRDTIHSGTGSDSLFGNGGRDSLNGDGGRDIVKGGPGNDDLFGNRGSDTQDGNSGNDIVRGGHGTDTIRGGTGDDDLFGGPGNDDLLGGPDSDTCTGGAGADTQQSCH